MLYEDLYNMDINELVETLRSKQKGLAYRIWKTAMLVGASFGDKFPENPEVASPELYPPKVSIKMPDFLKEKYLKKISGGR